jgi:hypothetical protein
MPPTNPGKTCPNCPNPEGCTNLSGTACEEAKGISTTPHRCGCTNDIKKKEHLIATLERDIVVIQRDILVKIDKIRIMYEQAEEIKCEI